MFQNQKYKHVKKIMLTLSNPTHFYFVPLSLLYTVLTKILCEPKTKKSLLLPT